jgi:putative membrane protein
MGKTMNTITGVAALALVFGAGPAFAQYSGNGGATQRQDNGTAQSQRGATANDKTSRNTSASKTDDAFVEKAASGGLAEVKLGQLAEEKGSNPAVKQFGRRMVRDHSKANDDLKSAAERENLTLPSEMDKADQATYDRLSKMSGEAFDKAYARDMVRDHSKDVAEFQKEAKNGHDEAIKNFAAQTAPTLQSHLDQARQMEQAVNQASNRSTGNENGTRGNSGTTGTTGRTGNTYPSNSGTSPSSTTR